MQRLRTCGTNVALRVMTLMIAAPIPQNETARLAALWGLHILDTPSEERFNRLTRMAMQALHMPIAAVNLIDTHRQWTKSHPGIPDANFERVNSFCSHLLTLKEPLIIEDTLLDRRFFDNPMVTGKPGLRAYAGIPLFSEEGYCLGAFCALDTEPHQFSTMEISILKDLAAIAQDEITNMALSRSLREVQLAQQNAEKTVKAKSDFLAMMSHEIRTPLNGIIGVADLFEDADLSVRQRDLLNIIRVSGESLLTLINDILDFSKIESGYLELESIRFDPRQCIEDVLTFNEHRAAAKGIRLESHVSDLVPTALRGDPLRLRQVLLNLTGNALKFTEHGEVRIEMDMIEMQPDGRALFRFSIRDTGIGILLAAQTQLFQAFHQADSSITRSHGGTGLGLAICKKLAGLMGGELGVESMVGEGSTFTFTIACPVAEDVLPPLEVIRTITAAKTDLRVLVVDDTVMNQRVVTLFLKKFGCTSECVGSGAECLERMKSTPFDIVLMDIEMPLMDGFETTRHIRQPIEVDPAFPRPWVVALTAHAMEGYRKRCLDAGMDDYITKPLRANSLAEMFESFQKARAVAILGPIGN
jgi:signal transduction histidine kinase/ActR/RegA family two-component response regulator